MSQSGQSGSAVSRPIPNNQTINHLTRTAQSNPQSTSNSLGPHTGTPHDDTQPIGNSSGHLTQISQDNIQPSGNSFSRFTQTSQSDSQPSGSSFSRPAHASQNNPRPNDSSGQLLSQLRAQPLTVPRLRLTREAFAIISSIRTQIRRQRQHNFNVSESECNHKSQKHVLPVKSQCPRQWEMESSADPEAHMGQSSNVHIKFCGGCGWYGCDACWRKVVPGGKRWKKDNAARIEKKAARRQARDAAQGDGGGEGLT